jgi:hypothetical protein
MRGYVFRRLLYVECENVSAPPPAAGAGMLAPGGQHLKFPACPNVTFDSAHACYHGL